VRYAAFKWGEREIFMSPALKFPRQCPLVLLAEICLREGEALGNDKV
jgi:hypothetical protein